MVSTETAISVSRRHLTAITAAANPDSGQAARSSRGQVATWPPVTDTVAAALAALATNLT